MNIEVIRLKKDDQNKLIELFLDCFSEDVYYQKLFPNKNTIRNDMKISFQEVTGILYSNTNKPRNILYYIYIYIYI